MATKTVCNHCDLVTKPNDVLRITVLQENGRGCKFDLCSKCYDKLMTPVQAALNTIPEPISTN